MKRPVSKNAQPSEYAPEVAQGLRDYFADKLALARTAKASGTTASVIYPTVAGYAAVLRISENTIRHWARRYPQMAQAIESCRAVRQEFAALNLPMLQFDTEAVA